MTQTPRDDAPGVDAPTTLGGAEAPLVVGTGLQLVQQFCAALQKTVRSAGIYSRNNAMLSRFLETAGMLWGAIGAERGDLDLDIRADRFTLEGEVVLQDADRENGLPFRFYREGVRRLTLQEGMPREELEQFIAILATRTLDEDLVTLLWRAALPHVRYVTVDIGSAAYQATDAQEEGAETSDQETAIRHELDALLAAIYSSGTGQKVDIRGLSIGTDDLLALKVLGTPTEEELATVAPPMQRALYGMADGELEGLRREALETDAQLMDRALDVLLDVLFRAQAAADSKKVIEQMMALYDSLLLTRDFRGAAGMVDRVRLYGTPDPSDLDSLRNVAIVRQITKLFISEQRLTAIVVAVNEMAGLVQADLARLLATLGQDDPASLLPMLAGIQNPQHRRLLVDSLLATRTPTSSQVAAVLRRSEWFVARDLLYLLSRINDDDARSVIIECCTHEHPRVRQGAVAALAVLPPALSDNLVMDALKDPDAHVRQAAVRLAAQRKLPRAVGIMQAVVADPGFGDRDLAEIRTYLMAYAVLGGAAAVETLDRILNPPLVSRGADLLSKLRGTLDSAADSQKVDLRIAAAAALGAIEDPAARAALQKAERSVIPAVKAAAHKALGIADEPPPSDGGGRSK